MGGVRATRSGGDRRHVTMTTIDPKALCRGVDGSSWLLHEFNHMLLHRQVRLQDVH